MYPVPIISQTTKLGCIFLMDHPSLKMSDNELEKKEDFPWSYCVGNYEE